MKWPGRIILALATAVTLFGVAGTSVAKAQGKSPNILVIMGDDVGWFNIGAYHRGTMSGKTPNLGVMSGLDWFPTLVAAAGNPNITDQLLKGVKLGDRTYKNHLDGYNQLAMLTSDAPSARHELFYFAGPHLGALRIDDFKFQFIQQPYGWPGEKLTTDMPTIVNIRQDPFERNRSLVGNPLTTVPEAT